MYAMISKWSGGTGLGDLLALTCYHPMIETDFLKSYPTTTRFYHLQGRTWCLNAPGTQKFVTIAQAAMASYKKATLL